MIHVHFRKISEIQIRSEFKIILNLPIGDRLPGIYPPGYFQYTSLPHRTPQILTSLVCSTEAKAIVFLQVLTALKSYYFILQVILSCFISLNGKKCIHAKR